MKLIQRPDTQLSFLLGDSPRQCPTAPSNIPPLTQIRYERTWGERNLFPSPKPCLPYYQVGQFQPPGPGDPWGPGPEPHISSCS